MSQHQFEPFMENVFTVTVKPVKSMPGKHRVCVRVSVR